MGDRRILIVEDEAPMSLDLKHQLLKAGYTVSGIAFSGKQALALVEETEPDLVLMDINLGKGMNGIETAAIIYKKFKIPVVYMTAYTDVKTARSALETNPYGYITKPLRVNELLISLQMAFRNYDANTKLQEANQKLTNEIEERKKAEEALKISEQNLKDANTMKDKLFTIIAHDLRNAFSIILSGSYLLAEQVDSLEKERVIKYAKGMREMAIEIDKLLENLLTWSRLQMDMVKMSPAKLNLAEVARLNVNLFAEYAQQKNITLSQSVREGLFAYADYNMVNTVIRNLMNNALKFSSAGDKVHISASNKDEESIEISISDTGIGIKKEHISQLFRIDSKLIEEGTSGETGNGLGLPLCREFVEKNNGEIRVESEFGKGSTFTFTLPKFK